MLTIAKKALPILGSLIIFGFAPHSIFPFSSNRHVVKSKRIYEALPCLIEVVERSRFDMDAFDGVYVEEKGLSSGKIEWREVAVKGRSGMLCNARSGTGFEYTYVHSTYLTRPPGAQISSNDFITYSSCKSCCNFVQKLPLKH